ncbi:RDD family protein [Terrimonas pollutisoli]|uniref:RDD family protein n=1 Tax=Terrimonas pollutisoli TaxID=3034147 RepID=UPI0023EB55C9|nr:RDD family protein [Terrimonas sp. H1YJ31]
MSTILELLNQKYTVFVGSDAGNDVVFTDPGVSPRHCQVSKVGDNNFLVADLGSATGTFVNNKKIDKEFISESDFITVGENIFQLTKKISPPIAAASTSQQQPKPHPPESAKEPLPPQPEPQPIKEEKPTSQRKSHIDVYFLSAPEDENICRSIDKHLSTIRFNTTIPIAIKGDFKIGAGENIHEYREQLFTSDIVLVFVSVDLLNNDECYERLKKVIANHNSRKTTLLPILARNCMWKATPFANLPLLPKNQHPLNDKQFWNSEDDALTSVVDDIYKAINELNLGQSPGEVKSQAQTAPIKSSLEIDWRKNYLWKVFWKRVAASLLDVLIIGIPLYILFYLLVLNSAMAQSDYYYYDTGYGAQQDKLMEIVFYYILIAFAQIVICAFMESSRWRGTPGKRIMKLQITDNAGNPLSFGKAFVRNIIKWIISAFTSFGNGILLILYIIAQVIAYSYSKKFFHDQLSNTVIGERLS